MDPDVIASILAAENDGAAMEHVGLARRADATAATVKTILDGLRKRRHFGAMAAFAELALQRGHERPYVRRQYAQAMIERGELQPAICWLEHALPQVGADDVRERSEVLGLLGRAHKQLFVTAPDRDRAVASLQASVRRYAEGYPDDVAWHGANLVALTHRAERDGLAPGMGLASSGVADRLLGDLGKKPLEDWEFWDHSSAANAYLALGNVPKAIAHYGTFANHPSVDGFAIGSEVRQLRDIWGVRPTMDDPAGSVLLSLEAKLLDGKRTKDGGGNGGSLQATPSDMSTMAASLRGRDPDEVGGQLQAILGNNATQSIRTLITLLQMSERVCQVVDRAWQVQDRPSGGSGFLVDGALLGFAGQAVLVTNNHVLSSDGHAPSVRAGDADAIFHYWQGSRTPKTFRVAKLLWEGARWNLDVAIATLVDERGIAPAPEATIPVDRTAEPLGPTGTKTPDRIFVIGHPDGRGLEVSLSDNDVIDHELRDTPRPAVCRIHYGAPTEAGMSGSPVLDARTFAVLAIHRMGRARAFRPYQAKSPYLANEAQWIGSVIAALGR